MRYRIAGRGIRAVSRIRKVRCKPCGKILYRTEDAARYALGLALTGNWEGTAHYALAVYPCPHRKNIFHIGHNPAVIRVIEDAARKSA